MPALYFGRIGNERVKRHRALRAFRLSAGALGWSALAVQFVIMLTLPTGPGELTRAINYFSYFTIQSNVFAAAALTVPELADRGCASRFLLRYEVRTALALYMVVTCGAYAILLAHLYRLSGIQYVADITLHYVMPPLYAADWLLISPERRIAWKNALLFLIFPFIFGVYTLLRGACVGLYPYPFVDVGRLGYHAVLVNYGRFFILFLALGALLIALARWRARTAMPPNGLHARGRRA